MYATRILMLTTAVAFSGGAGPAFGAAPGLSPQTVEGPIAQTPGAEATAVQSQPGAVALPGPHRFDRSRAYVSSIGDGVISAVDLESNEIAWTLKVSDGAEDRSPESAMGIAASPDGRWVYTGDAATDEVVIVDADRRRIAERISVPHQVHGIDISPGGRLLWVSGQHPEYPWLSRTTIIDTRSGSIRRTLTPGLGNDAHYAFTPGAEEVWGASVTTNLASVYDADSGRVLAAIPLVVDVAGTSAEAKLGLMAYNEVAISPDGARAYVVGPESGTVFAVDVRTRAPIERTQVGERTHGVAVTRDGREVWTANNAGTVTILDAASLEILETLRLHEFENTLPYAHVAFSHDGRRAYVSFASDLAVIDVMTRELVTRIDIGTDPHEISLEDYHVGLADGVRVTPDHPPRQDRAETSTVAQAGRQQQSSSAGITVTATLERITPMPTGRRRVLTFAVAIDTHAGDLMDFDPEGQVSVWIDGAPTQARVRWNPESESSHHRVGILGVVLEEPATGPITLVLRDLGVAERRLRFGRSGETGPESE